MGLGTEQYRVRYRALARVYDSGLWLYRAMGMQIDAYRVATVHALRIDRGDTVVDLGCGTGLNFPHLQGAVGPEGRIIGVDLTDAMLQQAHERVQRNGWRNVTLVEADLNAYRVPATADAVIATLALATLADYDGVIARAARDMRPGARIADLELRWPERWPAWLAHAGAWLNRPAGVTPDMLDRLPAESIRAHFTDVSYHELYFGAACICAGRARDSGAPDGH